jgi:hypothetical protein
LDKKGKELEGEYQSDREAIREDLLIEHYKFIEADVIFDTLRPKVIGASYLESSVYLYYSTYKYLARRA